MSTGGLAPDGKVYCKHMEEAAKHKSNTPKNPNRDFYCCRRFQGDPDRCNFWFWADQVPRLRENVENVSISSAAQSPALRPSRDGTPRAQPISTPSARPSRQRFSPPRTPAESPQRKKRMDAIEAGLRQRQQDLVIPEPGSSEEQGISTSPSDAQAIHQPPSPVPTEIEPEVEARPRKSWSFLGLIDSPESTSSVIREEGQPSTPKKRRISLSTEGPEIQPAVHAAGLLLTPPQSNQRSVQHEVPEPVSPIVGSRKGKERERTPPIRTRDQDSFGGEPLEDALPLFTLPEDTSSTSSVSPTIAENVLDYNDGIKARAKAVIEFIDSFDIAQAAKLLQTIERQKIQYECRDRSQKLRIEELLAEKDTLVAEISRLKEELERSEQVNRRKEEEVESFKALVEYD